MKKTCRICKGTGKIVSHLPLPMTVNCARCSGTGQVTLPDRVARQVNPRKQKLQEGEE